MLESESTLDEAVLQRGGDENRGRALGPERVAEPFRDVDGRVREQAGLRPHDQVGRGRFEADGDVFRQLAGARGNRVELVTPPPHGLRDPLQLVDQDESALVRKRAEADASGRGSDLAQQVLDRGLDACLGPRREADPSIGRGLDSVRRQASHGRDGDPAAEPARRGLLELVGLVEDDGVVVGKHSGAVAALPQREVGEVERVVGDHEVGLRRPGACVLGEARGHAGAPAAQAAVGADGELGPQSGRRLRVELGAVAGPRRLDPGQQALVGVLVAEQAEPVELDGVDAPPAEVVLAALDDGDPNLTAECRLGKRHVLGEQLLLKRLRRRGHDDAAARLEGRDQVGEALAGTGSRLRQQVFLAGERALDGACEGELLLAMLVARDDGGKALERVHADRLCRASAVIPRVESLPTPWPRVFALMWAAYVAGTTRSARSWRTQAVVRERTSHAIARVHAAHASAASDAADQASTLSRHRPRPLGLPFPELLHLVICFGACPTAAASSPSTAASAPTSSSSR